jgi:two-component system chemotaxis response regulator CheY
MKILIVDDSLAARMLMSSFFEGIESYQVFEAANGEEAVKTYKKEKPDVTFLDLTMPIMNGFEALKIIREFDPHAAVIILTADIQKKTVERIMELGAYTVIKKLPKKETIFEIIDEVTKE